MRPKKEGGFFSRIFNRFLLRYWIIAGVVILAVVAGAVIVNATRHVTSNETALYQKSSVTIGIGTTNPSFGAVASDGTITGFDRDVAAAIMERLYPDVKVQYVSIEQQETSYLLKNGTIDMALAMLPTGVLKTEGISLSNGYFMDSVYPFVTKDSAIASTNQLQGKRLFIMDCDCDASEVTTALKALGFTNDTVNCTAYPDAVTALKNASADAIISPKYKIEKYSGDLKQLQPKLIDLNYRVALWRTNSDALQPINDCIRQMKNDGTLEGLKNKWNIKEDTTSVKNK